MTNIICNYDKIKLLGGNINGGRTTWLAKDEQGQQVVIKEFNFGSAGATWDAYKAIEKEAEALASLNHPQIPKLLEQRTTEAGYEIVMEYIEGQTLADLIGASIDEKRLRGIAIMLLEVLTYCQDKNILHRDIKPENIIIDSSGTPCLVDFGLARNSANVGASTSLTGTIGFMPPEQWKGIFKPASDLYSLGVTLVCLATGTKTSEAASLMGKNFALDFDLHSQYGRDFDKWLHELTAVEVDDRPQTAKEAITQLGAPVIVTASRQQQRLHWPMVAKGSGLVVLGVAGFYLLPSIWHVIATLPSYVTKLHIQGGILRGFIRSAIVVIGLLRVAVGSLNLVQLFSREDMSETAHELFSIFASLCLLALADFTLPMAFT
jgi:serine/threonine protein kinase